MKRHPRFSNSPKQQCQQRNASPVHTTKRLPTVDTCTALRVTFVESSLSDVPWACFWACTYTCTWHLMFDLAHTGGLGLQYIMSLPHHGVRLVWTSIFVSRLFAGIRLRRFESVGLVAAIVFAVTADVCLLYKLSRCNTFHKVQTKSTLVSGRRHECPSAPSRRVTPGVLANVRP